MGFPLREKTAWVLAFRTLVMVPEAESPSVMKMDVFSRSSSLFLRGLSLKWMRQSRSLRLYTLAFLLRSRVFFWMPAISSRSAWDSLIFFSMTGTMSMCMCR